VQQLDPKAVWLFFIHSVLYRFPGWMFLGVFLIIAYTIIFTVFNAIVFGRTDVNLIKALLYFLRWIWIIIPFLPISFWILAKLDYHFYRYELRKDGFRKELGIIWKKYVTIPYDKIQNVDIHRGLIARILGLSSLNIQTAGASVHYGSEGSLPGVSCEVAEQLRDELIKRARQSRTNNQGA